MKGSRVSRHPLLLCALALAVLPYAMGALGLTSALASEIAIFAMVGVGFNLLLGYTGLVSFGHGAYFGLAAYAAALIQLHLMPQGFFGPIILAVLFAALLGAGIGFLILRRRGVYFSLLTLAFTAMFYYIVYRWTSFTGGENGLGGFIRPSLFGLDINNQLIFYYLVAAIVFLVTCLLWRVVQAPFGTVLVAIRENEQRAKFLGYPVQRYKLLAFVLSTTVAGLGGSLFAFLKYFVSADLVHVTFSGEILAMSIIGGMRHFLGPPLGTLFFILFREILSEYTAAWEFYFGLLFMAFILFSPTGLVGLGDRLLAPFRRREELIAAMAARVMPQPTGGVPPILQPSPPLADAGPVLECHDIGKYFGNFRAVSSVHLQTQACRLHALIGPNGAGKTTLFNVLSGMYPPDTGTISFLGKQLDTVPPERIVSYGLARSFQITNLFPGLSVYENLRLSLQAHDARRFNLWKAARDLESVHKETAALMAFLGLEGLESAQVSDLSYGGQRLMEIGLALGAKPTMLLLDEPLAGLSTDERERIVSLIRTLTPHMGVLLIEHDIDRVFAFSDYITVMNNGEVLVEGTPEVVRGHAKVQEIYLGRGYQVAVQGRESLPLAASKPVLQLQEVNTYYGKSHILHDVTLEVREQEVVALVGRNGAGKSSTFKSIMGLNPARRGRVLFEGSPITRRSPEDIARLGIGLVPQGRRLFPTLTVAENLFLARLRHTRTQGTHWEQERIFHYFPKLRDLLGTKADVLSGGEQQMVAIARALSGHIKLLLLDEPFEGLSPAMKDEVFNSINQLRGMVAILIVEHDLDRVLALADRVYVLDRGRISHQGPAQTLLTDLELRKQVLWL